MDAENLSDDGAPPPTPKAKPKSKANKKPKASPKKVEVASPKKTVEKSKAKGGVKRRPAAATSGGADAEQEPGDGEPAEVMRRPAAKKPAGKPHCTKYMYHKERKWGVKRDGKEMCTAGHSPE